MSQSLPPGMKLSLRINANCRTSFSDFDRNGAVTVASPDQQDPSLLGTGRDPGTEVEGTRRPELFG
ncbi:hypothetical protein VP1G_10547 [Cytospora mali]|uniref:Uncharacterized protein n=1 Tax=Cytospora mali TaxID=578113 RepID=A0A194UMK1_CYTMA|nr:hypothetical protein VP1G_10547 [Valsa mali var. pyri (nom. inval.)]